MNLAKLSANGQITVPIEVREILKLKTGDKILFVQNENGEIVIHKASTQALLKEQKAFKWEAEKVGIYSDDDVQKLVDEIRKNK